MFSEIIVVGLYQEASVSDQTLLQLMRNKWISMEKLSKEYINAMIIKLRNTIYRK